MKKTKLALTAIVAFAAATLATGAVAHEGTNAHKHGHADHHADHHAGHHAGHVETTETHSSSFSHSSSNAKVDALESQLQAMQAEIRSLRAASGHHQVDPDTAKVQELDQWMNTVKHEGHSSKDSKDNMVFFRGGYGHNNDKNPGTLGQPANTRGDKDSWYFGAGFDFGINDNLFGMMQGTEFLAELMFDYKQVSENIKNGAANQLGTNNLFTLAASPKIKFLKGSAFRPWLIPVGFELSVNGQPSPAISVLNPGMMFGAGADYKIWKDVYVGADARYHYSADDNDQVNNDGVTAGGYVGFGF
ncbi:MAG: porin family protein [Methylococcales bacterium]|nr:porin family protein [Methylococcales bacterium]